MTVSETGKVVDDFGVRFKAGLRRLLRIRLEIVDAADTVEELEFQPMVAAKKTAYLEQVRRLDHHKWVNGVGLFRFDPAGEFLFQNGDDFGCGHESPRNRVNECRWTN